MVFSSLPFLFVFLPLTLIIYYLVAEKYKNIILLIASLIFYSWGEPIYIVLMIFSAVVDYNHGRLMEKYPLKKKWFLISSLVVNLGLLIIFKYSGFILANINEVFNTSFNIATLALPIGISFYTFQTMSYSIDVYRGTIKAEKSLLNFLTYVSMFPQLIAGPIVRYHDISSELQNRSIKSSDYSEGILRFTRGLAKKVLIANQMGLLFDSVLAISNPSIVSSWLGIIAFALQIYFDFSGYSDMAIGIGRMLGFHYLENFNFPYIARSVTDFWHRWHISLSNFFKDYLYIPLGGNRVSKHRHIINIMIVWGLTGLWHGAQWNFIFWGLYFGVILIIEKYYLKEHLKNSPVFVQHFYTLFIVLISWALFALDLSQLPSYLSAMFGFSGNGFISNETLYLLKNFGLLIVIAGICSLDLNKLIERYRDKVFYQNLSMLAYVLMIVLVTAYLVDSSYNPFLYFRF
ncbi:MAG: MBOAT family O-acyltransferase [Erysipelotrichaceae bacterium]